MPSIKSSWITRFSARRRTQSLALEKAIAELERAQSEGQPFTEPNGVEQSVLSTPSEKS
jgi:hypothetical protein